MVMMEMLGDDDGVDGIGGSGDAVIVVVEVMADMVGVWRWEYAW